MLSPSLPDVQRLIRGCDRADGRCHSHGSHGDYDLATGFIHFPLPNGSATPFTEMLRRRPRL